MPTDQMGMGDSMPPGGGAGAPPPDASPPGEQDQGPHSIFLSKESLGGKTVKEGDTLTLTIKSVDPETGDAEASISGEGASDSEGGIDAAFDQAMPPEPGEGGY